MRYLIANYLAVFYFLKNIKIRFYDYLYVFISYFFLILCDIAGIYTLSMIANQLADGLISYFNFSILILVLFLRFGTALFANYQINQFVQHLMVRCRGELLTRSFTSVCEVRSNTAGGKLVDRMVRQVQFVFNSVVEPTIRSSLDFIVLIVLAIYVIVVSPELFFVCLASVGMLLLIFDKWSHSSMVSLGASQVAGYEEMTKWIQASGSSKKEQLSMDLASVVVSKVATIGEKIARSYSLAAVLQVMPRYLVEFGALGSLVITTAILSHSERLEGREYSDLLAVLVFAGLRAIPLINSIMLARNQYRFGKRTLFGLWAILRRNNAYESFMVKRTPFESLSLLGAHIHLPSGKQLHYPEFNISRRGVWVITGPSGIGKSSFLDMLAGLREFEASGYALNGKTIIEKNGKLVRLEIKNIYLQQFSELLPGSVSDNLMVLKKKKKWLPKTLELLGMTDSFLGRNIADLSGGEKFKVRLARLVLIDPIDTLILMDEPTASLDDKSVDVVIHVINHLAQQNAVVIVSHDFRLASRYHEIKIS